MIKVFIFLAILLNSLVGLEAKAFGQCTNEEISLKKFINLRAPGCQSVMYYENGSYAKQNSTWYYKNGTYAKQNSTWYYPNGTYAKQNSTFYYSNGTYAKQNSTLYFSNGTYAKQNSTWYHKNGQYAKVNSRLYYPNGTLAGDGEDITNLELVQFITGSECSFGDFDILCAAAAQL